MSNSGCWKPSIKTNIRGLDLMQTVYAVIIVLGLREVFLASHPFLTNLLNSAMDFNSYTDILFFLLFFNAIFLAMRFFWVPRNLRRLIAISSSLNSMNQPDIILLSNYCISINWIIIILHGALYYFLCEEFSFIVFSISSDIMVTAWMFSGYIAIHVILLILNGLWIGMLDLQERRFRKDERIEAHTRQSEAGLIWSRSNLTFGLFAFAPFAVAGTCQPNMLECFREDLLSFWSATLSPFSPLSISFFYDIFLSISSIVAGVFNWDFKQELLVVFWSLSLLMVNSLVDIFKTSKYYILFEDHEWGWNK